MIGDAESDEPLNIFDRNAAVFFASFDANGKSQSYFGHPFKLSTDNHDSAQKGVSSYVP